MTGEHRSAGIAAALLIVLMVAGAPSASAAVSANADDIARFLAGLEPSRQSSLLPLTRDPGWQQHAKTLNLAWSKLDKDRLSKIRAWSAEHLAESFGRDRLERSHLKVR
jgi:hypothetical protein